MAQLIVLYKTPKDTAAFDKHYTEVHIPLVHKIPNLRKFEISRGPVTTPMGPSDIYLVAALHFDDMATLHASFASPEGRAGGADAQKSLGEMEMLIFDSHEV
jgi:uncharacterized protein (TIGR02118 family)